MTQRVDQQPGWVIHRRPWRESSLLVEFFSQTFGRVALVAKGARAARSAWRGLAEPFVPLQVSWTRRGEMGTVTSLEAAGSRRVLGGRTLYCGLYVNELLLRLLERDDPHEEVFSAYETVLSGLAAGDEPASLQLRRFELALLGDMGVAPDLGFDAASGEPIRADGLYHLEPEAGLLPVDRGGRNVFSGAAVLALAQGRTEDRELAREMRELTRVLIDHQLGGRPLASRQLLAGLQRSNTGGKP